MQVGVKFSIGSTDMAAGAMTETLVAGGRQFEFTGEATCTAAGASATFIADAKTEIFDTSDGTSKAHVACGQSATRTIDTTASHAVDIKVLLGSSGTFYTEQCTMELVG